MGKVTKVSGEVISDVVRVVDTADGFIRVEQAGGHPVLFIRKTEVAEVSAPIGYGLSYPLDVLKRKVAERKRRKTKQQELTDLEEAALVSNELLCIDQKPDQCHCCGKTELLRSFPFGLAKSVSSKRTWSRTVETIAVSTALAAVFLPLAGRSYFRIALPEKKRRRVYCDSSSCFARTVMRSRSQLVGSWVLVTSGKCTLGGENKGVRLHHFLNGTRS